MSQRGSATRTKGRKPANQHLAHALAGAILCGILGVVFAGPFEDHLGGGQAVDNNRWNLLIPGMDEAVRSPERGRGTRVQGGVLAIVPHAFGRSDRVIFRDPRPIGQIEVKLAPDSATAVLALTPAPGSAEPVILVELTPSGFRTQAGGVFQNLPPGEPATMAFSAENKPGTWRMNTSAGPRHLASRGPGGLELTAAVGEARYDSVRIWGLDGELLLEEAFEAKPPEAQTRATWGLWGILLGSIVGTIVGSARTFPRGLVGAGLLLLPVFGAGLANHTFYLDLVERLYLTRLSPASLRGLWLGLAMLPALAQAMFASGLLQARERGNNLHPAVWPGVIVGCLAIGARSALPPESIGNTLGLLVTLILAGLLLVEPLLQAKAARLPTRPLFIQELPTMAMVAILGPGAGLLPAAIYRMLRITAAAPVLIERAPQAGSRAFVLALLLIGPGIELGLRETFLGRTWSAENLDGSHLGAGEDVRSLPHFWRDRCGQDPAVVWFLGGSSTGGAYQLGEEPEAFFPAQVHTRLCATGHAVETWNYGNGARDSWSFSRGLPGLLDRSRPDLVVFYGGVNDLLTANSPLTRKERERLEQERAAGARTLGELGRHSRLLSGLGLLLRTPEGAKANVPSVPLPDAAENLRSLAEQVKAAGGHTVLVPELVRATVVPEMRGYRALQAELAQTLPGISIFDLPSAVGSADRILIDRNHLSREGHAEVGELLAPVIAVALDQRDP